MNNWESIVIAFIGILCIPLSAIILRVVFSPIFGARRWHRTGLWIFALGYGVLGLALLGQFFGLTDTAWVYLLADASLVIAPCVILVSYVLENGLYRFQQ